MRKIKNILCINFGGIGDEIFFLPTITSLKKEYQDAKITLVLEPRSRGVTAITDLIDDIITIDIKGSHKYSEMLKLIFEARKHHFDMVISSGANKLISVLLFLMGIRVRCGYYTGLLSKVLLTHAMPLNKNQYACQMYHDLIRNVTSHNTVLPQINIKRQETISNSVIIHPGVSKLSVKKGCIKTVPASVWAEVIDLLASEGKKVILTGGPDDKGCIDQILSTVKTKNFENLYGTTKDLKELAELISSADKFLCSDSAPLHIAVSLGVKTYVIFGPTDDRVLIPQSPLVIPIKANDNCPLKPCLWTRRVTTCENLDCLNISPNMIVESVNNN